MFRKIFQNFVFVVYRQFIADILIYRRHFDLSPIYRRFLSLSPFFHVYRRFAYTKDGKSSHGAYHQFQGTLAYLPIAWLHKLP